MLNHWGIDAWNPKHHLEVFLPWVSRQQSRCCIERKLCFRTALAAAVSTTNDCTRTWKSRSETVWRILKHVRGNQVQFLFFSILQIRNTKGEGCLQGAKGTCLSADSEHAACASHTKQHYFESPRKTFRGLCLWSDHIHDFLAAAILQSRQSLQVHPRKSPQHIWCCMYTSGTQKDLSILRQDTSSCRIGPVLGERLRVSRRLLELSCMRIDKNGCYKENF